MRNLYALTAITLMMICFSGGCTPPAVHDAPCKAALEALLASDEFTQEERDAVESIKVHNETCWVWLKKGFTDDGNKISEVSRHIAVAFAEEFWSSAMDNNYTTPKYYVQVWMIIKTDKGTHKANPCDAHWDLAKQKVYPEEHGLAEAKEIR